MSTAVAAAPTPATPPPMDSRAAGRFDDFSDKLSPMLVKELRQGLRAKTFVIVFLALQGLLATVLLISVSASEIQEAGETVSKVIFFFFSLAVLVVQPLRGVGALHNEIKGNTIDLMVLTRLGAWRIVLGKWVAIVSQSGLLLTAIVPYLILRYFFGGMNLFSELLLLLLIFIGSTVFTAFTVGLSAIGPILIRGLVPLGMAFGIVTGICEIIFDHNDLQQLIEELNMQQKGHVWGLLAFLLAGGYLGWISLGFGTSLIAPMAENHSTSRRLVALGTIIVAGVLAHLGEFEDEVVMVMMTFFCVPAVLFALTEPFQLLPPICRPFVRLGALGKLAGRVLYPGWPSGVVFTGILLAVAAGIYYSVPDSSAAHRAPGSIREDHIILIMLVGSLLMPAVLLRLFGRKVRQPLTFYLLMIALMVAVAVALGIITDETKRTSPTGYVWFFCWIPPVDVVLMDVIRYDFYRAYRHSGMGYPTASPDYTPVLLCGIVTAAIYYVTLLLFAVRAFAQLREVEDEAASPPARLTEPEPQPDPVP